MKKLNSQKGAALVIALITLMVVTSVSLSLSLLTAKSLGNSMKFYEKEQARVMAVSLCRTICEEIEADKEGRDGLSGYLKEHIGNDWTWYEEGDAFHGDLSLVQRTFRLTDPDLLTVGKREMDAEITLYWISDAEAEAAGNQAARSLVVQTAVNFDKTGDSGRTTAATTLKMIYRAESDSYWWMGTGVVK